MLGAPADLAIVDPDEPWICDATTLVSQGHHTPYAGRELVGRVRQTWVGGRCVHERARR